MFVFVHWTDSFCSEIDKHSTVLQWLSERVVNGSGTQMQFVEKIILI